MATSNPPPPPSTNGTMPPPLSAPSAGNRKKQKRRAKQAAKAAQHPPTDAAPVDSHPPEADYEEDPLGYGEDDYEYSDAEPEHYHNHHYMSSHAAANGDHPPAVRASKRRNKKKAGGWHEHDAYNPDMLPPPPNVPPPHNNSMQHAHKSNQHHVGSIWNTSTQQERQNIKDFWLSLSEEERKSLLKIEKEAVLRKMKQQQKHSCSCTVCGRKRTAIEEELEVLYEGYYEELEQYAHHDHPPLPSTDGLMPVPLQHSRQPALPPPPSSSHRTSHLHEHLDDEEYSDEEEYSDDEEEYSDEEPEPVPRPGVPDFFNFGQNLTVKGILTPWLEKLQIGLKGKADNLLTVADDLLKNDGRKFIEMMEQLAERRMQRETEAEYAAANPTHPGAYPPSDTAYNGEDSLAAGDEFDDDEASYDSQEEYDDDMEEEDEMGGLTEEQRMQEGRRMFQIFAARMFEQRVLTAYREKVAAERQRKLLEELEDETNREAQKEAKKQRDAQKKKDKKKQQQQAKAEEKARKEAEKAAEDARLKEAEEKKQEEQRRKKEEQRKKREEERKKQDEERARKEAEKQKRAQEEQQRREETERKAREHKAAEKAKKEEARKREREEREAREKEARERKTQEEKDRKDREGKARSGQPLSHQNPPQIAKRPSQAGVAVPAGPKAIIPSPRASIATPSLPKAPTPAKQRQASQQGSHASSPKQSTSQSSSGQSKASSPSAQSASQHQPSGPKTIMQKPGAHGPGLQHPMQATSPLHQQQIQPPPGMPHNQQHPGGFGGMGPMGFAGFPGPHGPMMQGNMGHRGPMPMYPHQGPPMGVPNRMPFGPGGLNGMPTPPPGMMHPQGRGMMFPFDNSNQGQPPPGFGQQHLPQQSSPPIGPPHAQGPPGGDAPRGSISTHSRQHSSDKDRFDGTSSQPISRPAPIQRPGSVKPGQGRDGSNGEVDDLSKHLGSSALLADDDEPLLPNQADARRHSGMVPGARNIPTPGLGQLGGFGAQPGGFGAPGPNWTSPSPFGQPSSLGQQSWGSLPNQGMTGWAQNNNAFATNAAFGSIGAAPVHRPGTSLNRPLTIRLAVCQACRQLSNEHGGQGDGYHDVNELLHRIGVNRPLLDSPPTLRELEEICETEGDFQNGGGELHIRRSSSSDAFAVKWEPDSHNASDPNARGHVGGLGEIGSPVPAKTTPAIGFGAPGMGRASSGGFQSIGTVRSPGSGF